MQRNIDANILGMQSAFPDEAQMQQSRYSLTRSGRCWAGRGSAPYCTGRGAPSLCVTCCLLRALAACVHPSSSHHDLALVTDTQHQALT
jgi:hypothetical protein